MVTLDVLGVLLYSQVALAFVLFFAVQLLVLIAHGPRFEQLGDWIVYKGSWLGIAIQLVSLAILASLVYYAQTDHSRVTYVSVLIVLNTAWFVTLRLAFLVADYRIERQMRKSD
jgi:hypothetical protein